MSGVLVEVWSDVVCPWCHVGVARFEEAVADLGWDDEVEVRFRAFELPQRPPKRRVSTFDAHRLLQWALATGGSAAQVPLHRRLLRAVVEERLDPSDHAALVAVAAEVGLDADAARHVLASGAHAEDVRAAEAEADALDIHAVPTFRIAGRFLLPGAQDPATFASILRRARDRFEAC